MQTELHTPHRSVKVRVLSWNVVDHGARCLPCSQRLLDYLAFQLFDFELPDKELYLKRFGCDARWFLLDALRQNSLTRMYVVLLSHRLEINCNHVCFTNNDEEQKINLENV